MGNGERGRGYRAERKKARDYRVVRTRSPRVEWPVMRRLLVLLALSACAGFVGVLILPACGGNDKPPLTPDSLEGDTPEGGAPSTPTPPPPK